MWRVRFLGALAVLVSVLAGTGVAHAGPVEQLIELTFQPGAPDTMTLRYQNGGDGMFYSRDGGSSFALACTSLIDPTLTRGGPITLTGDGKTLMGMFDGMWQDDGTGCSWSKVPQFEGLWITDFATDPTDPSVTYAISSNGGMGKLNGIFRRDAGGNWTDVGTKEEMLIGRIIAVTAGGKLRFYESAVKGMNTNDAGLGEPNYVLRSSDDGGATWEEHVYGSPGGDISLLLQAVDPTNPDRIVISLHSESVDDQLLVSSDKGATFSEYLTLTDIGGVAFAPDGRIWIGDKGSTTDLNASTGLFAAASLDKPAQKIADYVVQCLAYEPTSSTLYACQHWFLGKVDTSTGEFNSIFKLTEAQGFLSCPGQDMAATCKTQLCSAYCGAGHFAQAPLCTAYDEPGFCGPSVSPEMGGTGGAAAPGGTGGMGGTGGAGVAGTGPTGTGATGGTVGGTGGQGPIIDMTAGGAGSNSKSSGGCSAVPGQRSGALPVIVLAAGLALAFGTRRRRRR